MTIKITRDDHNGPNGKVADVELHFEDGPLAGLKLVGFAIWRRRPASKAALVTAIVNGDDYTVTFPARKYTVNGEGRSFALLRPITDAHAQNGIRDLILAAWAAEQESN